MTSLLFRYWPTPNRPHSTARKITMPIPLYGRGAQALTAPATIAKAAVLRLRNLPGSIPARDRRSSSVSQISAFS